MGSAALRAAQAVDKPSGEGAPKAPLCKGDRRECLALSCHVNSVTEGLSR